MSRRNQLGRHGGGDNAGAAPALARPDDAVREGNQKRSGPHLEPVWQPAGEGQKPTDLLSHLALVALHQGPRETDQHEARRATGDEDGPGIAAWVRDRPEDHDAQDQGAEYETVDRAVDRDARQDGAHPDRFEPRHQPRPDEGTDPERHKEIGQVAGLGFE